MKLANSNINDEIRAASPIKSRCHHSVAESVLSFASRSESRSESVKPKKYLKKGKLYRSVSHVSAKEENVDWNDLNVKIEDWFQGAKTPGILKKI